LQGETCRDTEEELCPPRLITGNDLIALGFKPRPLFSTIPKAVEDAQLNGHISTAEEARRLVMEQWGEVRREA